MIAVLAWLALAAGPARPAAAQTTEAKTAELERRIDALSEEVERLKLGSIEAPAASTAPAVLLRAPAQLGYLNLGGKLGLGGYAEFIVSDFARRDQKGDAAGLRSQADLRRFVLAGHYSFTDWIVFKFEVEFEHAGTGEGDEVRGEAGVEQAFLDFRHSDPLNVRAGHLLIPMGFLNEVHEPTTFHGALRPSVETFIIPTTWHENGLGLWGRWGPLSYESYLVSGLQASPGASGPSVDGFTGSNGLNGASTEGSNSPIEDKAWVTRLDLRPLPGILAGGSIYLGKAGQDVIAGDVPVTLWEGHASGEWRGAELKALYAEGTIGDADAVNAAQLAHDPAFADFAGRKLWGGYVQGAYNVLSLAPGTKQYLAPFARWERFDTAARTPTGFAGNPATSRVEYTAGLTYKPIPAVAIKTDYQWKRNEARTGVNQWNLGLGLIF